ncbi:MAG TPA: SDR family oxidoreductase [Candidatus Binatia bacterium]|nr:SDR family oxidoreductase [Candidatus Binatia bacterium]
MRSVLITGTSKGIGYETALAFARSGYRVHATMRNPSQSPLLAETAAKEKLAITVSAIDVDDDESVRSGIARIQKHSPLDVLVNNAGVERFGSIEELSIDDFRAAMETNFFGVLRCCKAVVPQMRERKSGTIINISSVAGTFSQPPATPYCASKWALEALSEGLACEMKTFGVRVALVEPGIIDTAMARRISTSGSSAYPHAARIAALFASTLTGAPVPPSVVAEKVVEIDRSGTWQLRHPIGPDAVPLIAWRKSMTDEQWVDLHSADDETFQSLMAANSNEERQ